MQFIGTTTPISKYNKQPMPHLMRNSYRFAGVITDIKDGIIDGLNYIFFTILDEDGVSHSCQTRRPTSWYKVGTKLNILGVYIRTCCGVRTRQFVVRLPQRTQSSWLQASVAHSKHRLLSDTLWYPPVSHALSKHG